MSCRQSCRRRPFFKNFFSFSCDTDFSVCKSISCCSGLLHCSFWYFQLSQDFSCFCTTCVSKPEIWSSRVAAGREVTCRKKNGLKMAEEPWTASTLPTGQAFSGDLVVLSAGDEVNVSQRFLSAVTSPYTSWPLPPTCTPVPSPQ